MRTWNLLRVRVVKIASAASQWPVIVVICPWFAWWTTHFPRCQPTSGRCRFRYRPELVTATCRGLTYSLEYPSRVVSRLIALVRESVRDVSVDWYSLIAIPYHNWKAMLEWSMKVEERVMLSCYILKNNGINCTCLASFFPYNCLFLCLPILSRPTLCNNH